MWATTHPCRSRNQYMIQSNMIQSRERCSTKNSDADGEADPEAEDEYDSFVEEQGQVKAPWPSLSASWQRRADERVHGVEDEADDDEEESFVQESFEQYDDDHQMEEKAASLLTSDTSFVPTPGGVFDMLASVSDAAGDLPPLLFRSCAPAAAGGRRDQVQVRLPSLACRARRRRSA